MIRILKAHRYVVAACIALSSLLVAAASACDWDTETLLEERSRFPTALEIILGKFPRHTKNYYQWRLNDRLEKRKTSPNDDALLDDIAVSYEKLERYDEAIKVASKQLERNPDRYESLANLGTFLIHDGQLREGLRFIEKAVDVNPDAHFGREKYQVILVKYVLSRSTDDGVELPLGKQRFNGDRGIYQLPFKQFLDQELLGDSEGHLSKQQRDDAIKGILGMMRFSRYDSPILLEALGELQEYNSARQLAYRAYSSASQQVDDPIAKERYQQLASHVLEWSRESWKQRSGIDIDEKEIADDFRAEQTDADAWFQSLAADEQRWIAEGVAVDAKFNEKYREIPEAITTDPETQRESHGSGGSFDPAFDQLLGSLLVVFVLVIVAAFTLFVFWKRHRESAETNLSV